MEQVAMFQSASQLRALLQGCLLLLLLWNLLFCARWVALHVERLGTWERHPAVLWESGADELTIEIAATVVDGVAGFTQPDQLSPFDEGKIRVHVPSELDAWYRAPSDVSVLQNPVNRADLRVLNFWGIGAPLLVRVVVIAVLLLGWKGLNTAHWGEDMSWVQGQWVATGPGVIPAGASAGAQQRIVPADNSVQGPLIWSAVLGLIVLSMVPGMRGHGSPGGILVACLVTALFLLALYSLVSNRTRSVQFDTAGVAEITMFGAHRVPWQAIGSAVHVDINAAAGESHDRSPREKGFRPQRVEVYELRDHEGREILNIDATMQPPGALFALLARIRGGAEADPATVEAEISQQETEQVRARFGVKPGTESTPMSEAEFLIHTQEQSAAQTRTGNSVLVVTALVFTLLFAWLGGPGVYRAAWFSLAAERSVGTIVALSNAGAPALTVEFHSADGATHRIETDGSISYRRFQLGDALNVMYDPAQPANARAVLFLENWFGVCVSLALYLLLMSGLYLFYRQWNTPFS